MVLTEKLILPSLTTENSLYYFLLIITGLLTGYHYWFQSLRHVKLTKNIPKGSYLPTLPMFGNALEALLLNPTQIVQLGRKIIRTKGNVLKFWFGNKLFIGLADPKDVELILKGYEHLEKADEYKLFEPWLGDGLLISKGDKWKNHRKIIAPTFHSSILKTFVPIFNKNSQQLIEKLMKESDKTFDVHDYMSGVTVDILLETAMGVKKKEDDDTGFNYAMAVMNMCNILHLRHYKIWLRSNFLFNLTRMATQQDYLLNIIHSLTRKVIQRKKIDYLKRKEAGEISLYDTVVELNEITEKRNNDSKLRDDLDEIEDDIGEKRRLAFLDYMIEASHFQNNRLTDEEIKEEVDTIMFEGHDTTAAGSSFVLSMLGIHQNIQEKVVQELHDIFGKSNRSITFTDTLDMKYLERVIMETLRMYPPVPVIGRKVNEDVKLVSGDYTIPKGSTVGVIIYQVHRNPDIYSNPDLFDPDNFLPERCQNRHYYSFIPFSAGPRSCVGRKYAMLKLKILIASILRTFKIYSDLNENDFRLQGDIILKRAEGFKIRLEERKAFN